MSTKVGVVIRELPDSERPREKLLWRGPQALEPRDLLAIVLRTGRAGASALMVADELLAQFGSLQGLGTAAPEELAKVPGVGLVKATQLAAAFELGRRSGGRWRGRIIRGPDDAAHLLMPEMRHLDREEFRAILLDTRHQVIAVHTVSIGHLSGTLVHPRELFKECIRRSSAALIVAHNHPSGDPSPSADDLVLTRRLVEAGHLLGIEVLDHLVLGDNRYISLKEQGLANFGLGGRS